MKCRYNYKGHWFNSELEFDDFLLENQKFESKYGDLVFSRTPAQNTIMEILDTVTKDTKQIQTEYKKWKESSKITYNEDGEESFEQPPYIGVNKFLSKYTTSNNKRLFPEFIEDNYWSERYSNWKLGQFTDDELQEFGFNPNNLPKITNTEQQDRLKKQMTHRWEIQAITGSAIHNILQLCFTQIHENYAINLPKQDLLRYIDQNLESKNKKYVDSKIIEQAIDFASKLYTDLKYKFGNNLVLLPEFTISQTTNILQKGTPTKLLGIIDLLIIDQEGQVHILDYKTSVHNYSSFNSAKKLSYNYQLAVYQRMLAKYGINTNGGELLISPIQLFNFRKDNDQYVYDGLQISTSFIELGYDFNADNIWENIDEFMPTPFKLSITTQDAGKVIAEAMSKWFPYYSSELKTTRESVISMLKNLDLLKPDENGIYRYNRSNSKQTPITATSESEFVDKVLKHELSQPVTRLKWTDKVKRGIKEIIKNGIDNASLPTPVISNSQGSTRWLRDILSRYDDGNWEVQDNELLESYGIIMLKTKKNIYPRQVDFIRVSLNNLESYYRNKLDKNNPIKNRKGLTGTYEPDVLQKSKSNSLMVDAINGNIELMETMLVINQLKGLQGYTIGNIQVVNPRFANGISMSNEELLYCFNELNKHDPISNNNIGLGDR